MNTKVSFKAPAIKPGRKTKEWEAARAELKKLFASKGITYCEKCGSDSNLSFAHSKKRRHIVENEIYEVALLCIEPCHNEIERKPEYQMTEEIKAIIKKRGWDAMEILGK